MACIDRLHSNASSKAKKMSKKFWPIFYCKLLHKMGKDLLDIQNPLSFSQSNTIYFLCLLSVDFKPHTARTARPSLVHGSPVSLPHAPKLNSGIIRSNVIYIYVEDVWWSSVREKKIYRKPMLYKNHALPSYPFSISDTMQ